MTSTDELERLLVDINKPLTAKYERRGHLESIELTPDLIARIQDVEVDHEIADGKLENAFRTLWEQGLDTQTDSIEYLHQFFMRQGIFVYRSTDITPLQIGRTIREYEIPDISERRTRVIEDLSTDRGSPGIEGVVLGFNDNIYGPYIFSSAMRGAMAFVQECQKGIEFKGEDEDYLALSDLHPEGRYEDTWNDLDTPGLQLVQQRLSRIFKRSDKLDPADLYQLSHELGGDSWQLNLRGLVLGHVSYNLSLQYDDLSQQRNMQTLEATREHFVVDHENYHFREQAVGVKDETNGSEYSVNLFNLAFSPMKAYTLGKLVAEFFMDMKQLEGLQSADPGERAAARLDSEAYEREGGDVLGGPTIIRKFLEETGKYCVRENDVERYDTSVISLLALPEQQMASIAYELLTEHYGKSYEQIFGDYRCPVGIP